MLTVVAYEMKDDTRRRHLVTLLENSMQRVQDSLFEGYLDGDAIEELVLKIQKIIDENSDQVHVYTLCRSCHDRQILLGQAKRARNPLFFWV